MTPRSKPSQSLGIEATLWDAANKMRGNMNRPGLSGDFLA